MSQIKPERITERATNLEAILRQQLRLAKQEITALQQGGGVTPAANVEKAAGSTPTKAEFDALIDALIGAGLMESA